MSQLSLEIPQPLLADAQKAAERQHLSLDQYVLKLLAESVRDDQIWAEYCERGKQITRERFLEIINKGPKVPPEPSDRLD